MIFVFNIKTDKSSTQVKTFDQLSWFFVAFFKGVDWGKVFHPYIKLHEVQNAPIFMRITMAIKLGRM